MNSINIGLVTEGQDDNHVLRWLVQWFFFVFDPKINVKFQDIQPAIDSTSGRYSQGGWYAVYQWCVRNPPVVREQLLFSPIFDGIDAIDMLVIQLDADVLDELSTASSTTVPNEPWSAKARADYVGEILNEWLWPETRAEIFNKHINLPIVWSLETWLMSVYDSAEAHLEEIDPKPIVIRFFPELEDRTRPGKLRKRGVKQIYDVMRNKLLNDPNTLLKRCSQAQLFRRDVLKIYKGMLKKV